MKKKIRIGNAGGYWGDDLDALRRQLTGGPLDYVTSDFLAEITMSILQKQRARDHRLGYAVDFVDQIEECLPIIARTGTRVITNAGGVNPLGLGRRLAAMVAGMGLKLKIGVVYGDDITDRLHELTAAGEKFTNLETGEDFAVARGRVTAANIYFGAAPVVRALDMGCDVVVTGRVTDTGITLAPMIHEFGWRFDDWDRLAAGVVAGHIIECGCQASGGNLSDWRDVPHFHDIGYPIVEMESSGEFTVTKHPRTGGLVSEKTVKEQLVYEMGDPAAYISPDGVARFDTLSVTAKGPNRVRVAGVRGGPRTPTLKVSMAYADGWKASGDLLVSGPDVQAKCEALAGIFWRRLGLEFEQTHTAVIGGGSVWPDSLYRGDPNEALLRFAVRDQDRARIEVFGKALPALILSGPSGLAVQGGRPRPSPVVAYWPALIDRGLVTPKVLALAAGGGEEFHECVESDQTQPAGAVPRTGPKPERRPRRRDWGKRKRKIRLREIAYARSGDKGDTCNIGVLARGPAAYDWLRGWLTPARVRRFFADIALGEVTRFELDNLLGLNFLLEQTLGGGGTVSLLVDPQGKTLSQALLEMEASVPAEILKS